MLHAGASWQAASDVGAAVHSAMLCTLYDAVHPRTTLLVYAGASGFAGKQDE